MVLFSLFLFLFLHPVFADNSGIILRWRFYTNEQLFIEKYTQQDIIKNGQLLKRRDLKDYTQLIPAKILSEKTSLKGVHNSYEKQAGLDESYKLTEVYDLDFVIYNNGKYEVSRKYLMPTVRSIPTFPETIIKEGEMWEAEAEEVFEFQPPVRVPVIVSYQLLSKEKKFNIETAKISINYIIHYVLENAPADIPYKYLGFSNYLLWFDYNHGQPVYAENIHNIMFIYRNGVSIEYKAFLKAYYNRKKLLTQAELKEKEIQILKSIPTGKGYDTKITSEGVIITLGEVFFEFDKADLKQEELEKLDKIVGALKNYSEYEIIIEGHTDNVGSALYNQQLSEKRARNVMDYLIKKGGIKRHKAGYIGKGETEPIFPNDTPENRQKNRRVEIIIKPH